MKCRSHHENVVLLKLTFVELFVIDCSSSYVSKTFTTNMSKYKYGRFFMLTQLYLYGMK